MEQTDVRSMMEMLLQQPIGFLANNSQEDAQFETPSVPQLEQILNSYNVNTLQLMAQNRGLAARKKNQIVTELANKYYDANSINHALSQLSEVERVAFNYIYRQGGLVSQEALVSTLTQQYKQAKALETIANLVGAGLALFAQETFQGLNFQSFSMHDYRRSGFYGSEVLFVPQSVIEVAVKTLRLQEYRLANELKPYQGEPEKIAVQPNFEAFVADILALTRYVEQNKVRVLKSGDMGKRDYVKLNAQLQVKEGDNLAGTSKLSEVGRINLLWNTAIILGLIEAEPDNIATLAKDGGLFYELPRYQQMRLLIMAWVAANLNEFFRIPTLNILSTSLNENDIPTTTNVVRARAFLMNMLELQMKTEHLPEGWLDFNSLLAMVKEQDIEFLISRDNMLSARRFFNSPYNPTFYYSGFNSKLKMGEKTKNGYYNPPGLNKDEDWNLVEGEYIAEIFREPLAWIGAAELGENSQNRPVAVRFTELGRAALLNEPSAQEQQEAAQAAQFASAAPELTKPLLVQPNFDLMVLAPMQNLALLRQIDRFASQSSMGDVAMYHLSKESVFRGFRTGLDGEQILEILKENSRIPVAQNIEISIQDWSNEYGRVVMRPVANLVEVPDAAMLDKIMAEPKYADCVEKRIGPTFALIKGPIEKFDAILQEFMPKAGDVKRKQTPLVFDYNRLQPRTFKPVGDYQIQIKEGQSDPYVLYRLGQFADLVEYKPEKQSATFELTAAAGQRARSLDLTYQQVSQFLANMFGPLARISPVMTLALKGWLGYYSNEVLRGERSVTVTGSPNLITDIVNIPDLDKTIITQSNLTTLLVRESEFSYLRSRLRELGIRVQAPSLLADGEVDDVQGEVEPEVKSGKGRRKRSSEGDEIDGSSRSSALPNNFNPAAGGFDLVNPRVLAQVMNALQIGGGKQFGKGDGLANLSRSLGEDGYFDTFDELMLQEAELEDEVTDLHSPSSEIRQEAVTKLKSMGIPAARRMVELLYDPDPRVRYNACVVLASTGDAESLRHLKIVEKDNVVVANNTIAEIAQTAGQQIRRRLGRR